MKNTYSIFKREFWAYFNSPVAYIFIIIFLILSGLLFMVILTPFFARRLAEMRLYFEVLPLLLWVFIPALTMRVWSEERQTGTLSLLFALPMRSWELALGKYLAALACYLLTVVGTACIPITVFIVGYPDPGPIIGGYVGVIMLGAMFLAIGVFFSALFRDQVAALAVAAIVCFVSYALGFEQLGSFMNNIWPGAGTFLRKATGGAYHYYNTVRGVVELQSVLFFASYTLAFLILNVLVLGRLRQPGQKILDVFRSFPEEVPAEKKSAGLVFVVGVILILGMGVMLNAVTGSARMGRIDLTEGKIFTVSPEAKNILGKLRSKVRITYYVSPEKNMPTPFKELRRDVTDKLADLASISENLQYEVVVVPDNKTELQELEKQGIVPFQAAELGLTSVTRMMVWSTLDISYADKDKRLLNRVDKSKLANLEYEVIRLISLMDRERPPHVTFVAPMYWPYPAAKNNPKLAEFFRKQGRPVDPVDRFSNLQENLQQEGYEVTRVDLTAEEPLPKETDAIVVMGLHELEPRQKYEIARALYEGIPVILGVQRVMMSFPDSGQGGVTPVPELQKHDWNPFLKELGLSIGDKIVCDVNHLPIGTYITRRLGPIPIRQQVVVDIPPSMLITPENLYKKSSISNKINNGVFFPWATKVKADEKKLESHGLDCVVLATTTEKAWELEKGNKQPLSQTDVNPEAHEAAGKIPLAVKVEGSFPDLFKGKRPAWKKEPHDPNMPPPRIPPDPPETPKKAAPGTLLLFGSSEMFANGFLQKTAQAQNAPGNYLLMANALDTLALEKDLAMIRSKQTANRLFNKVDEGMVIFYYLFTVGFVPLIFLVIGIARFFVRSSRRESYVGDMK